jgi:RecA-family ATPase
MNEHAYPDGFANWSEAKRNSSFAQEAKAYDERRRAEKASNGADLVRRSLTLEDALARSGPSAGDDDDSTGGDSKPESTTALPFISAASFAEAPIPPRLWIVPDMIPDRTVTIVTGDGGGGKTTVMLQLAVAIAGARPWLGHNPDPGPVLVVTAEDDEHEIHRRVAAIAKALTVDLADLGDLHIVPLAGQDAVMGAPEGKAALIAPTSVFRGLVALVERIKPRLVVLDALADVYGGEENARAQARQFIGLLRGLAIRHDLAVVLIAHLSLSGMASGSGTSGSTAWSNSVRARLYLERILDESNREIDSDLRVLRVKKSNYGPVGIELRLRWQNGAFILDGDAGGFDKLTAAATAERVFLELLVTYAAQSRDVSNSPGANYAPTEFERQGNDPLPKEALKGAMKRLLLAGRIIVETVGPPSRRRKRLVIKPQNGGP